MELEPLQIALIISLIVVAIGGFWNQKRIQKKKKNAIFEGTMYSASSNTYSNPDAQFIVSNEIDQKAKDYINQYKSSYPRESLEQGLLSFNITSQQAKELVNKYF